MVEALPPGFRVLHDRTASVLSLARNVLAGLDLTQDQTSIRTASLELLLKTLIELGEPPAHVKVADQAKRSVESMIAPKLIEDQRGTGGGWL
jgi:hypothetical protein